MASKGSRDAKSTVPVPRVVAVPTYSDQHMRGCITVSLTLSQSATSKVNLPATREGTITSKLSFHTGESVLYESACYSPLKRNDYLLLFGL
jgi:hypothetical protein